MDCAEYKAYQFVKQQIAAAKTTQERLEILKVACKRHFLLYCYFVHHDLREKLQLEYFVDTPEGKQLGYHGELCAIGQAAFWDKKWYLVASARGFAKSLILNCWLSEYACVNGEFLRVPEIIKISDTGPMAVKELKRMKDTFTDNTTFIGIFGPMQSKPWNEDEIQLTNGINVKAKGAEAQHRGMHPGMMFLDDIHSTEEAASKDRRTKTTWWVQADVVPQLTSDDRLMWVGTHLNRYCAFSRFISDPDTGKSNPRFTIKEFVAIIHPTERRSLDVLFMEGRPLWRFWDMEKLELQRRTMGDRAFLAEYMGDPFSDEETVFKPEWFDVNWVSSGEIPGPKEGATIVAYDPAYKEKEKNDFTGWAVIRVSQRISDFGRIYLIEANQAKMSHAEKINHIFLLQNQYQPEAIAVEEGGTQSFADSLNYVAILKQSYPNIISIPPGNKQKIVRAHSVSMLVQNGIVKFIRGAYPEFVTQLITFKGDSSEHDDMVDAFVYALKIAQQWHLPKPLPKPEVHLTRLQMMLKDSDKKTVHPITGERLKQCR